MTMAKWMRRIGFLAAALLLAACAAAVPGAADAELLIRVQNNLVPPTSLTVWAVPATGTRQMLGTVDPSTTATLRFDPAPAAGQYRLMAETTAGTEIVSNPVVLSDAAVVQWDLSSNIATVTETRVQ